MTLNEARRLDPSINEWSVMWDRKIQAWRVMDDIEVEVGGVTYTVPVDFITDLASVPRPLWSLFPPFGDHIVAAIVHDYLYSTHMVDKDVADRVFLSLMVIDGTRIWRAYIMYRAVDWFGSGSYKSAPERQNKLRAKAGLPPLALPA